MITNKEGNSHNPKLGHGAQFENSTLFQWSETVLITLVKPIYSRPFIGTLSLQLGENSKICIESHLSLTIVGQSDSGFGCVKNSSAFELCADTGEFFSCITYLFGGRCCLTLLQKELPKGNVNLTISMADSVYKMCKSDSQKSHQIPSFKLAPFYGRNPTHGIQKKLQIMGINYHINWLAGILNHQH